MKFTLDAAKWRCGANRKNGEEVIRLGRGDTSLLNEKGYQCCVGQFAEQCGIEKDRLLDVSKAGGISLPTTKSGRVKPIPFVTITSGGKWNNGWVEDKQFAQVLYTLNDDTGRDKATGKKIKLTVEQKVAAIRKILKAQGHSLRVINLKKAIKAAKK